MATISTASLTVSTNSAPILPPMIAPRANSPTGASGTIMTARRAIRTVPRATMTAPRAIRAIVRSATRIAVRTNHAIVARIVVATIVAVKIAARAVTVRVATVPSLPKRSRRSNSPRLLLSQRRS